MRNYNLVVKARTACDATEYVLWRLGRSTDVQEVIDDGHASFYVRLRADQGIETPLIYWYGEPGEAPFPEGSLLYWTEIGRHLSLVTDGGA